MEERKSYLDLESIKEKICEGKIDAYEKLFKQTYPYLRSYAYKLLKNREAAEEIASDVLINIWKRREELAAVKLFRAYLYKCTRNACYNYLRKGNNTAEEINIISPADNSTPESIYLNTELKSHIQNAVLKLPPQCKACFVLVKEEGLSYREAAQILSVSVKTVDAQIVIALRKILKSLTMVLK